MTQADTLRSRLRYEPRELKFGTSGRRGEIVHLTHLEVYLNALAELGYLQSLARAEGGIVRGEEFCFALDLRPSSEHLAQAIVRAIRDAGMEPVNLGRIPTPALTCYALSRGRGSIMVTGSHIPFDRNGYKTNTSVGELLKHQEAPICERVRRVRERLYNQPFGESAFDERGSFKTGEEMPPASDAARRAWIERYASFFEGSSLQGQRLVVYQHSAVGRDLLAEILERLGAEVIPAGRSETFVPIDTENIDAPQLAAIQVLADEAAARHGATGAVVSTDGDSDRPLIAGVEGATGRARFFGGDLVGMIVAEFLGADAVVVPISCNDAIDRGALKEILEPKTRIGSPYVIAGMDEARRKGKRAVCGWEANGGFLTGSVFERNGKTLAALPTRDAFLPILCVLFAAHEKGLTLPELFARLPRRFSRAALLKQFPRSRSLEMLERFSGPEALEGFFTPQMGFGKIARIDHTDGVRIYFDNGDVAHLRPSGNADELRVYAVADTQERADQIAQMGVAEPGGILRRMERAGIEILTGSVRHYEWGGYDFIPGLLGIDNRERKPFAELWIAAPGLPYLLKVLDARRMLSIQVHPNREQAREGFARENALGIDPKSPRRSYKDDNHKPEVHIALTEFWMLHGFRPAGEIEATLRATPELAELAEFASLRELYTTVMTMPQARVDVLLNSLIERLEKEDPRDKDCPDFWALRAAREFPLDRGIFSIYLLNLVHLRPGQGTFQPAGLPHAYLEGTTVELMANSDNVLRGGLTPKHVEVEELLRTVSYESGPCQVLEGGRASAGEFELRSIELAAGAVRQAGGAHGPDCFFVLEGAATLRAEGQTLALKRGTSVLVHPGIDYVLEASAGPARLFKATPSR
ncbi:MAG: mannose-6-phosphate isomerase, class I [Acidobacteria bacterium]|nr:mannose-6-phosphate isomerase, class I [Acidobacteriota bacterium]